jgi:hypothetical protein
MATFTLLICASGGRSVRLYNGVIRVDAFTRLLAKEERPQGEMTVERAAMPSHLLNPLLPATIILLCGYVVLQPTQKSLRAPC